MKRSKLVQIRTEWFNNIWKYHIFHHSNFNYQILDKILYIKRSGRGDNDKYNDIWIMLDTETSKKSGDTQDNHVCMWTISLRAFGVNIATIWGRKPSTCIETALKIHERLQGDKTIFYVQNLSYDWVFLRKFFFNLMGFPVRQLNTKPHYPINIEFSNGIILKDTLILSQRSLEKWAIDLNVEHKKAVGSWNYDQIRNQDRIYTYDELHYAENDTLAGVECLDATCTNLKKHIYSMPYTATGIPRNEMQLRGKAEHAHDWYLRMVFTYQQQIKGEKVYHGGYTHANRHYVNLLISGLTECYDFASSYPFILLSEKFPGEKFTSMPNMSISEILRDSENNAYMFKLILIKPSLKYDQIEMPTLQFSKAVKCINPILDNGRVLAADYIEIYLTELDLEIIAGQYDYESEICVEVEASHKDYLPRWFTDYVFELFEKKTMLKGGDPVLYSISKAALNSLYGMSVQKPIKDNIIEDYETGDNIVQLVDPEEGYNKHVKKYTSVLPYQIGIWVTAAAFRNLFRLGKCCDIWLYSDTDSCYGQNWNKTAINTYNDQCKDKLIKNGYGPVVRNGREYWLGVAEFDGAYSEFKIMGAKRYCGRYVEDGKLHITVAGVPKTGAECLNDDINNFAPGFIFSGSVTNKKTHTYIFKEEVYVDEHGNETGDSVDLSQCDYLLDAVNVHTWDDILSRKIEVPYHEYV